MLGKSRCGTGAGSGVRAGVSAMQYHEELWVRGNDAAKEQVLEPLALFAMH